MHFVLLQTFCLQETIKACFEEHGFSLPPRAAEPTEFLFADFMSLGSLWSQVWFCSKHNWIQNNIWLPASEMNFPDKINLSTEDRTVFSHPKPTEPESRRNSDKLSKAQEFNWKTPTRIYLLEESPDSDKDRRLHFSPSAPFLLPEKLPTCTSKTISPEWDHSLKGYPTVTNSFIAVSLNSVGNALTMLEMVTFHWFLLWEQR